MSRSVNFNDFEYRKLRNAANVRKKTLTKKYSEIEFDRPLRIGTLTIESERKKMLNCLNKPILLEIIGSRKY